MDRFDLPQFTNTLNTCQSWIKAHFVMSFIGLLGYLTRKIIFVIIINFISVLLSVIGYNAIEQINILHINIYAICTSSLFGMVILYEIIADLFSESFVIESPTQNQILFLLTIPYFIDLTSGLLSLRLCYQLSKYPNIEFRRKYNQIFVIQKQQENQDYSEAYLTTNLCIVCLINERDIVLYRCGHKVLCEKCYNKLPKKKCPICRQIIEDVIHQYES